METNRHGPVPIVEATGVLDAEARHMRVLIVNRSAEEVALECMLRGFAKLRGGTLRSLTADSADVDVEQWLEGSNRIGTGMADEVNEAVRAKLPPVSWNILDLSLAESSSA
jgi:alpha-L-arabinofuranosidase